MMLHHRPTEENSMTPRERAQNSAMFWAIIFRNFPEDERRHYSGLCDAAWGAFDRAYIKSITW